MSGQACFLPKVLEGGQFDSTAWNVSAGRNLLPPPLLRQATKQAKGSLLWSKSKAKGRAGI